MSEHSPNPLLAEGRLPAFDAIGPQHVVPAVERTLDRARTTLAEIRQSPAGPTWESLVLPLERMGEEVERVWSTARHLHAVMDSPELREAYEACLPAVTAFYTELGQDRELHAAYEAYAASEDYRARSGAERRAVDNALREFRLGGVALEGEARERFAAIASRLSQLETRFANNVLDATQAWSLDVADREALRGLPDSALALARQEAGRHGRSGFRLTLDLPCYMPVMTFADDRALRRDVYEAYVTRASDRGPHAGRFDNGPLMGEILELRREKAELLGFESYAHYSLERKMARTPGDVLTFLRDLASRARSVAEAELEELRAFARDDLGGDALEAWDLHYFAEKLRRERFQVSEEDLRPYFPLDRVIRGMFEVAERLFDIRISPSEAATTWHPDVSFYAITDPGGERVGELYLDPYARAHKRGGAWMDVCRTRMKVADTVQTPVAYLTCNFTPPVGEGPALITHDEVTTLFHEFGHGLHHMLTRVELPSVAGISGVEWDAVELPSQFLENWCLEPQALAMISAHCDTGQPLPDELLSRVRAARNFHSALMMLRQIEFALFDFRLHLEYAPGTDPMSVLESVREEVAVLRPPEFSRFAQSFTHIFAGGYAAGYYSYKWAEVLSSDAFSRFEENGVFDSRTGVDFRREILERGGTRDAIDSFVAFRGREPNIAALLRHSGIEPGARADAA